MSTATDYGTIGLTLVGYGTSSGLAAPLPTASGLATFTSTRVNRDLEFVPVFQMTAFDTVALQTITWLSFDDATQTAPPTANPVINVSATRIR
jgi:hypothetical protein